MRRRLASVAVLGVLVAGCGQGGNEVDIDIAATAEPTGAAQDEASAFTVDGVPDVVATVTTGLAAPWGIAFLPDGRAVVTERDSGRVLIATAPDLEAKGAPKEGTTKEVGTIEETDARGEAGLLGVAVSPTFASDGLLYFYVSTEEDNRVVRAQLDGEELGATEPVFTGIPVGERHNGGRLLFDAEGHLFVATGEIGNKPLAQRKKSLAGKILRITTDGDPAPGNPFGTPVWSLGHRNVQGLTMDVEGSLWASEFGDSKADELNRIVPGENYGWPRVEGTGGPARFMQPALTWPTDEASPSGLAYAGGYLWMASLQGERLWRIKVAAGQVSDPRAYFEKGDEAGEYGRLRAVALAPDGRLWLMTNNTDGRATPSEGDDRILLVEP